ncbi:MAG: AAA family ATPase [Stenotrophomonas maltophilia]
MKLPTFTRLTIKNWRQFANLDIEFHPTLTIITGSNGAGKSTILKLLAQHFGWHVPLLATPKHGKSGTLTYSSGVWEELLRGIQPYGPSVGELTYSNEYTTALRVPETGGIEFNVSFDNMQSVTGMNIGSHRPIGNYQQVANIPTNALGPSQAYQMYFNEVNSRHHNSYTQYSPTYRMKEAIISMAMFGAGNQYVERNDEVARAFEGFKQVLSKILPDSIGFSDISVRVPDVVLETSSGDFVIDSASGGIMALIDLAWQIFLFAQGKESFVVLIDEPENHLHPSMQRSLLASLISAFPNAQFVVATHSPFMVSSVKSSLVYALKYEKTGDSIGTQARNTVSSIRLDSANRAGTASEILRDVLGVPVTLPEWAEQDIRDIAANYTLPDITPDALNRLRADLNAAGLGEYYPDALRHMVSPQ